MARVTYVPLDDDEILELDAQTDEPLIFRRGPRTDDWMILLYFVGFAALALIVVLVIGLGFMDLFFGNTG